MTASSIKRSDLQSIIDDIADRSARESDRGEVARYIPELACVDINQFGLAVAPVVGSPLVAGSANTLFSIQSVSKVFSLTLALSTLGDIVWTRVGREPSGDPFNSIVQLEHERGVPRNPFINAGAIVIADLLNEGHSPPDTIGKLLEFCRALADERDIDLDPSVAASELATGARNRALAQFMAAEGNIRGAVEDVVSVYFHQCSIAMSCRQLAQAARFLSAGGAQLGDAYPNIGVERTRRIAALMLTCGCYDASGEYAFRIGLPAKSGVGGGLLAIVPGVAAIAAWSPGLDDKGNSVLATRAVRELAQATGWSVFNPIANRPIAP